MNLHFSKKEEEYEKNIEFFDENDFRGWGSELGGQSEVNQARKGHADTLSYKIIPGKTLIENFAKLRGRFKSVNKRFQKWFWGHLR